MIFVYWKFKFSHQYFTQTMNMKLMDRKFIFCEQYRYTWNSCYLQGWIFNFNPNPTPSTSLSSIWSSKLKSMGCIKWKVHYDEVRVNVLKLHEALNTNCSEVKRSIKVALQTCKSTWDLFFFQFPLLGYERCRNFKPYRYQVNHLTPTIIVGFLAY